METRFKLASISKWVGPNTNRAVYACMFVLVITITQACNYYDGPHSGNFNGKRFYNEEPGQSFRDHVRWLWEMKTINWPKWIEDPPQPPPVSLVDKDELRATFVNQSSVLIQMDGINILTDPFWSDRAGPNSWLGAKRIRAPGVSLQDLPHIDLILISHDHYDHLDLPTLDTIIAESNPTIHVGLGVATRLSESVQAKVIELNWWDDYSYSDDLKITFVPARHSSGRRLLDKDKTLWGGYVLEGSPGRVLFFGDTAFGGFLENIRNKFEGFRLAILPIGSYEPYWFMGREHMNPEAAVRVHKMLNVHTSMGTHFGTVAEHPQQTVYAHKKDLSAALKQHNLTASEFVLLKFGEGRIF